MEDRTLLMISLICVFVGVSALFYIYVTQDLEEVSSIETHLDETVKIKGRVVKSDVRDEITFLEVERTSVVKVIFFEPLNLEEDDYVSIIGDVDKYKGEYEILGKVIE